MTKSNAGRPTVMTDEVIRLLEAAFLVGATDLEACIHADISKTSLYEYCQKNDEFAERKETLKNQPTLKAKLIIDGALTDGDLNTAHRVIDRKEGSKVKQEITGANGGALEVTTFNFIPVGTND
tara:strand:- start:115 stop:486 length:372 start_codon:yes stop_codon:yes gene_type:complete